MGSYISTPLDTNDFNLRKTYIKPNDSKYSDAKIQISKHEEYKLPTLIKQFYNEEDSNRLLSEWTTFSKLNDPIDTKVSAFQVSDKFCNVIYRVTTNGESEYIVNINASYINY